MPSLEIDNVKKSYDNFVALKGVSFRAEPGEFVVMVGPSGCGKSTLLRSIAGLETISSGAIRIDGRDIAHDDPSQRGVAMVFQNYALYPHMTVAQNMGFALKMAGRPKAEIDAAVQRAAQILRITEHLEKKPKALSGGQKQRVAIGRAITRSPDVFLFDEPLSNLDAALRSQMRIELGRLHAELKATMVYVTHDQTEAMTMASRIVVLNAGQIEQTGTPLELYNRPANRFVAGFLGTPRMNFFAGRVVRKDGSAVSVQLPGVDLNLELTLEGDGPGVGEEIVLGARPEALDGESGVAVNGTTAVVENLGREALVYVDAGPLRTFDSESQEGYLAVHRPFQVESRFGAPTSIRIDAKRLYAFGPDGRTIAFPQSH